MREEGGEGRVDDTPREERVTTGGGPPPPSVHRAGITHAETKRTQTDEAGAMGKGGKIDYVAYSKINNARTYNVPVLMASPLVLRVSGCHECVGANGRRAAVVR